MNTNAALGGSEPNDIYEVFAIRYAAVRRIARDNFLFAGDPHEDSSIKDFAYYIWVARNKDRTFVIDTGFKPEVGLRRGGGREVVIDPGEGLRNIGVDPEEVKDVVITHLHYDHVGNFDIFPIARYHLQDREMAFATGRHMCCHTFSHSFEVEEVVGMVRQVYAGRVQFHDGDAALAPGLSIHRIGGHTDGLQVVRVKTKIGWIVLASDASHLYENMDDERPFPIIYNLGDMVQGYKRLRELADDPAYVVPGHDPQVLTRYPAVSPELEGIAVRLDVVPVLPESHSSR